MTMWNLNTGKELLHVSSDELQVWYTCHPEAERLASHSDGAQYWRCSGPFGNEIWRIDYEAYDHSLGK